MVMDEIMVGLIVAAAVVYTLKKFSDTVRGKKICDCGSRCACASKDICSRGFPPREKPGN
jgi:hypothetical protein